MLSNEPLPIVKYFIISNLNKHKMVLSHVVKKNQIAESSAVTIF
jgi:hypothetical protein